MVVRHVLAIAILPGTVAVVVPILIARGSSTELAVRESAGARLLQIAGLIVLAAGVLLFVASLRRFASDGQGTLAPWDPPRRLVVQGPYRFVRNPMISGVLLTLAGEALVLTSRPHGAWALLFFAINGIYIPLFEEPMLAQKFGDAYREYCRHVPRLVPRLRPWTPPREHDSRPERFC